MKIDFMKSARRGRVVLATLALAASSVVALSGGPSGAAGNGTLTIGWGNIPTTFTNNFNPFSATSMAFLGQSVIYEPLWFFDLADTSQSHPWLAQSYAWSNSGKTLTFQLRHNVKWSDGQSFTAADVAYTFNLLKTNASLNSNSLPIASASAPSMYTAVVNFTTKAYADLPLIAGLVYIVPQHVWSTVTDPATWIDANPVGTGAYTVQTVTSTAITLVANTHYYQPGLPSIKRVQALAFNGNTPLQLAIENGTVDWGGSFISNINQAYIAKNKNYVVENLPAAMAHIWPNVKKGPLSNVAVRQAFSLAMDRPTIDKAVYDGQLPAVPADGMLAPAYTSVNAAAYQAPVTRNIAKAKSLLEAAGWKMGSGGFFEKNGQTLSIAVNVTKGWTDYEQILPLMASEEKAAGIDMTINDIPLALKQADLRTGNFQADIMFYGFDPSPYLYLKNLVGSTTSPDWLHNPTGYSNATVNVDLAQLAAIPNDYTPAGKALFAAIEAQIVKSNVVIPIFVQQGDAEFNGNQVTNFPTPLNPYGETASGNWPDVGWVMMHLKVAK